jgi:hypothetical protein
MVSGLAQDKIEAENWSWNLRYAYSSFDGRKLTAQRQTQPNPYMW